MVVTGGVTGLKPALTCGKLGITPVTGRKKRARNPREPGGCRARLAVTHSSVPSVPSEACSAANAVLTACGSTG